MGKRYTIEGPAKIVTTDESRSVRTKLPDRRLKGLNGEGMQSNILVILDDKFSWNVHL